MPSVLGNTPLDTQIALASDVSGGGGESRYAIVEPTLATSGTTVSATLQDHAVNVVELASTVTAATFTFPAASSGYARDLFVRLVITGDVPTITFQESGGAAIDFDVDDDSWAEIEQGVNIIMFTETNQAASSSSSGS